MHNLPGSNCPVFGVAARSALKLTIAVQHLALTNLVCVLSLGLVLLCIPWHFVEDNQLLPFNGFALIRRIDHLLQLDPIVAPLPRAGVEQAIRMYLHVCFADVFTMGSYIPYFVQGFILLKFTELLLSGLAGLSEFCRFRLVHSCSLQRWSRVPVCRVPGVAGCCVGVHVLL